MLDAVSALPTPKGLAARNACAAAFRRPEIHAVIRHIERHFAERITLAALADIAGLSIFRLVTVFRIATGVSPHRYLCAVRVEAAKALLIEGIAPAIVAIEVGFFDQSHLCRHFRAVSGMTPGQFLAAIRTVPCPELEPA